MYMDHKVGINRDNQTNDLLRRLNCQDTLVWAVFGKVRDALRVNIRVNMSSQYAGKTLTPTKIY